MFPTALLLLAAAADPTPAPLPPGDPVVAFRRAEELFLTDKFGEAEPLYRAALNTDNQFAKRQAYERLLALYMRSGRPDKAVRMSAPFRDWLKAVGDEGTQAEVDLLLGECYLALGHHATADRQFKAAMSGPVTLKPERKLQALRGRAEVAAQTRDSSAAARWAALEAAARETAAAAARDNQHARRIEAARQLAVACQKRNDPDAALAALATLPAVHDRHNDDLGKRDTQWQRANLLAAAGRYPEAELLFREALALHETHGQGRRMPAADLLIEWSAAAQKAGNRADAEKLRDRAAAKYREVLDAPARDPDSAGAVAAFVRLQLITRSARQFRQALALSRDADVRWANDPLLEPRLKSDRGGLELLTTSYKAARDVLKGALADLDAGDPPDLRAIPQVLVNLATAELTLDNAAGSEALLNRCAEVYAKNQLPADPVRAECDYLRGAAAAQRGDFAGAMAHFRGGLGVCDAAGPAADPVRFNLLLNTALIHKEQGDAAAAADALSQAAAALTKFADEGDLSFGLIDAVRADLHVSLGNVPAAVALLPRIEKVCAKNEVKGGYLWTTARHVRALEQLVANKNPKAAEDIWKELAEVQQKEGQTLLARTLNFRAIVAELQGRNADAVALFEQARAFQADRPRSPPVTRAITLWRLAALQDKLGKHEEAKKTLAEVFEVADKARLNTFGEAAQRATFFAQFAPAFELMARWHARDGDADGVLQVITRSRSRTLLDQMLAAGVDPRERIAGPNKDRLLARETAARQAVTRLRGRAQLLAAENPESDDAKKAVADLEAAQREYAAAWQEIVNEDPVTRALTDPAFADKALDKLRAEVVGQGGAVLAYLLGRDESYAVLASGAGAKPELFKLSVAKSLADGATDAPPPAGAVNGTGLRGIRVRAAPQPDRPAAASGPAVPLTGAVAGRLVDHYLRQVSDPGFNATRGIRVRATEDTKSDLAMRSETFGDMVLPAALRDRIKQVGAKRLVVIPDGALHKVPLECLTVSDGKGGSPTFALDELPAVAYAPSPAVLAVAMSRPKAAAGGSTLLTVGDPTYPQAAVARPVDGGGSALALATPTKREAVGFQGILPPLPYTKIESERIQGVFAPGSVTALLGDRATEKNVVDAVAGKRYVHLAAHGFADDRFGNLFAAVALTPPGGGQAVTADDDGFLSLHEIYRLPMAGCELTVLSACITNVGPQRPLEAGVTLAGGFLCAGSRRVMASCWSVDDKATAELMAEFFKGVSPTGAGAGSYAEAMRKARLAVRSKPGWESPFYWAPFVFVGPPD